MRRHFLCFTFFLVSIFVQAQKPDSTYYISSTRTENLLGLSESSKATDTTLDNIHNYYQTGVLGNMGLPSYSLIAEQTKHTSATFFSWNKLNNQKDLITEDDPLYFRTEKVYTKITAAVGLKQEQFLKLVHSQTIKKKVNVSLLFNRYSCTGFYLQQQSLTTNILLSSNYKTDNGRWGYNAYYLFNKLKYQLNGGIVSDTMVGSTTYPASNLIPTNFTSGSAKQLIKTSAMSFNTFFRLNEKDSAKSSHYLVYETNYQSNYILYVDGQADTIGGSRNTYFSAINGSHDSTGTRIFSNSLLYKFNAANGKFIFYGGYKNEAIKYHQHRFIDTVGFNNLIKAGFILNTHKHMLYATADYVVSGFNSNNYEINANYRFNIKDNFYITAQAQSQSRLPDFNLLFYTGNRFIWANNFSAIQTQNATFTLTHKKYKFYVGAFIQQQQNQVYFNTEALPTQYNGSTLITRFFAGKDLKLAFLHFNNYVNYQTTANTDIIRLPNWVTTHQLYCEGKFFKKNLWLQVGFQARYISSFMANAYMPATNQFYLQNEKSYGNYVFIDFFISAQIKPVKFFLMAQHLNQGFMGNNYILTPNYPMPDRSFKAGLCWMLFN
ncbi:MAG TPA: putative porin [Bacteroidia bacterium]|nr:putative porin [Bacteroidia bacterium]